MRFPRRAGDIAAAFFLAVWPWIFYYPVTLGWKVFAEGDINWLFSPIRFELARALAQGRLPLWSPGLQAGFPLFAEGEVAALYPLNIVLYRLSPVYVANSYTILFHIMWASIGMYLLVRSLGLRIPSAFLAGFTFGFSGFMAAHLSHLPHLAVASWLPWLLFLQRKYWQESPKSRWRFLWISLACLAIAVQWFGGFPQIALINLSVYTVTGLLAPLLWQKTSGKIRQWAVIELGGLRRAAVQTFLSLFVGTGIAAVQWVPTLELMGLSIRGQELSRSFFTSYSLDPIFLSQFVIPFWKLGPPHPFNMEYWGYVGIMPLLLAVVALFFQRDARTLFFVLLSVLAIGLALGGNDPLYGWLYYVPVFNRFRVPARFLYLLTFAVSFLAASGLEVLLARLRMGFENRKLTVLACAPFVIVTFLIIHGSYEQPIELWMGVWEYLPFGLIIATAAAIFLAIRRTIPGGTFAVLAVGLAVLDLTVFRAPFVPTLTSLASPSEWVQPPRTVLAMDGKEPDYRVLEDKHPYTGGAIRASLWTNLALNYGKQTVNAYLPSLGLFRNAKFVQDMSLPMRDLMNIRYYLLPIEVPPYAQSLAPPLDDSEPSGGLTLDLLKSQPSIPPERAAELELTSYTDKTASLPDGYRVGEVLITSSSGDVISLPVRLGAETADWALDGLTEATDVAHHKPPSSLSFPAYLSSVGRAFDGHKYVARYKLGQDSNGIIVTAVGVRSFLPPGELAVEAIHLIDDKGNSESLAALLHRQDLSLAFRSHTAAMWENKDALPRAFMIHRAESTADDQTLERLGQPDFNPEETVLLADTPVADKVSTSDGMESKDRVTISKYEPERVQLSVENNTAGYLVLTDSWYPGWVATVDGKVTPIYRADYMFRAVELAAGDHEVTFEYRPISLIGGAAISVFSLIFASAILLLGRVKAGVA